MSFTNRQLFFKHVAQTSDSPLALEIASASGSYLLDTNGKKYLDLISGISVSSLGHGNVAILEAVKKQTDKFLHTMVYGELVLEPQVALATRLCEILPPGLDNCFFVNSGSEAIEAAMKLAKRTTGRNRFVALKRAYHGSTQGALSLMSEEYYSAAYRPLLPNIDFITQNELADVALINKDVAAVFVEPIQGESGANPCTPEFLLALRERCNATGTLLVFDEIQCGMGRSGKLFAFEHYQVVPDILLLAKAFGGGLPLGACIARKEIMENFSRNPVLGNISTFGGHALSCAAGLAALNQTVELLPNLQIDKKNALFMELAEAKHVRSISGMGLLLALDLGEEQLCKSVISRCLEKGVFTDWFLYAPEKLRIAPPLTIGLEEVREALAIIAEVLASS